MAEWYATDKYLFDMIKTQLAGETKYIRQKKIPSALDVKKAIKEISYLRQEGQRESDERWQDIVADKDAEIARLWEQLEKRL